jgi:hypothetical protein
MAAQAAIAAKTAITAISLTGTALSITPRGRDETGVLNWVAPGTTVLEDVEVDFSYRPATAASKKIKSNLRAFSPKTYTDSTTGMIAKAGENLANCGFSFVENATPAEKQKLLDVFTSAITDAAFRNALINGDVMY